MRAILILETCYITNSHLLQISSKKISGFHVKDYFFLIIFYSLCKGTIRKDVLFELQLQTHCNPRNNDILV